MYYELNKREKKIARQLIDKGLGNAFSKALSTTVEIIEKWQTQKSDTRDAHLTLYKEINKHNDDIAKRYNGLGGSRWLATVSELFAEEVISEEDIKDFSDEAKKIIHSRSGVKKK